jgi:hypothetical protein
VGRRARRRERAEGRREGWWRAWVVRRWRRLGCEGERLVFALLLALRLSV